MRGAISTRHPTKVAVEYDCYGSRKIKHFSNVQEARSFYLDKEKLGKNPTVVGENSQDMAVNDPVPPRLPLKVHTRVDTHPTKTGLTGAYIRVSTAGQNFAGQKSEIERWLQNNGIDTESVEWFEDVQSGDNLNRPGFEKLKKSVFRGEVKTVVVYKLDRLSRSLVDGITTLAEWCGKGIRVVSVTQQLDFNGTIGKMLASILFAFAELEQETRRERQAIGIEEAKRRGVYKGRKPGTLKVSPAKAYYFYRKGLTIPEVAAVLKVSEATVCNYLRIYKQRISEDVANQKIAAANAATKAQETEKTDEFTQKEAI